MLAYIDVGVKQVAISSILPKKNIALTRLIRQLNNSLRNMAYSMGLVLSLIIIFQ